MSVILQADKVCATFGSLRAVREVSLQVAAGDRLSILGTNGAGKSTLFNLITGDIRTTSGSIQFHGRPIHGLSAPARTRLGISRSYQTSRVLHGLTVHENMFLAVQGVQSGRFSIRRRGPDDPFRQAARAGLAQVGLIGVDEELAGNLSHGQQRQLEIAMALASRPELLLLDEPAAGLSPNERPALVNLLKSLPRTVTIILIEHDMDVALQVGERVMVMHEGEVVFEGTPAETAASSLVRSLYLGYAGGDNAP